MKKKFYDYMIKSGVKIDLDVYEYGTAVFFCYLRFFIIVFLLAIFQNTIRELLMFIICFVPIRSTFGGFHFKNDISCLIGSIILVESIMLLSSNIGYLSIYTRLIYLLLPISVILSLGIVDTVNKRISSTDKNQLLKKGKYILLIYFVLCILLYTNLYNYINILIITLNFVTINSFFGSLSNRIKGCQKIKHVCYNKIGTISWAFPRRLRRSA